MSRRLSVVGLLALLATLVEAQPPVEPRSVAEAEAAQAADLERRLLDRDRAPERRLDHDRRVDQAIARLRAGRLDRLDGLPWRPPTGRGYRFGEAAHVYRPLIGIHRDRGVSLDHGTTDGYHLVQDLGRGAVRRDEQGLSPYLPVRVWADPDVPAEVVWAIAWMVERLSAEVHLVVTPGTVSLPRVSSALQTRFDACRQAATFPGAQGVLVRGLDCFADLVDVALEGCAILARDYSLGVGLLELPYRPERLYEACGPQPLVAPQRFEAIWRFLIDLTRPVDTEYLIIDPQQPPPRSARTVQQWVRHLMREQLD